MFVINSLYALMAVTGLHLVFSEVNMGTTIIAMRYKNGVVAGADTRTSVSSYVSNRYANKIEYLFRSNTERPSACVLCRSGSAADTQYLADEARWEFESRALRHGMQPSVSQAAEFLRALLKHSNRDFSASLICAGYENENGTGRIFSISPSGALVEEKDFAVSGSGSIYVLGLLDHHSNDISNMEEYEAIELISRALQLAMGRDGSSGGFGRIVVMSENGTREITIYASHATTSCKVQPKKLEGFTPRSNGKGMV